MANKKQSIKRVRQNQKHRASNKANMSTLRTKLKQLMVKKTDQIIPEIQSLLDKAAQNKLIPQARAARKLSRLIGQLRSDKKTA